MDSGQKLTRTIHSESVSKPIMPHNNTSSEPGHRYCFVDLPTTEQAAEAKAALDGKELDGNMLKVNFTRGTTQKWKDRENFGGWDRFAKTRGAAPAGGA